MEKRKFVAATNNQHKLKEFARILEPLNIEIFTAAQLGKEAPDPEETGTTFEENAIIKATEWAKVFGIPALADDSGICVDALDGAPGVYSARYSGGSDDDNNALLMKNLEGVPYEKRDAHYACAICCAQPNGEYFTVYAECHGKIGFEYKGENGFGYDPIFYIETGESFAEISGERKDEMSHRGKALRLLAEELEMRKKINPPEMLEEIKLFLEGYDYKVYTNQDENYAALKDGCYCIVMQNSSGLSLYIDLDWEFTLSFDAWHAHYPPYVGEYKEMLTDMKNILNSRCCSVSTWVNGKWRGSELSEDLIPSKKNLKCELKSDYGKDFLYEIKQYGVEVRYMYWNDDLTKIIKFEPNEL